MRLLCVAATALFSATIAPLQAQRDALDSLITAKMADADIVGFAAAVIVDRQIVWMKGYGHRDWQRQLPFTPATIMNAASIAKPVVGVAMMRAVAEGRLSLDADINGYLPFRVVNPHRPDTRITLRHLATHTSGITDRWEVYRQSYRFGADPAESLSHFLTSYFTPGAPNYAATNFLDASPGELREYSNLGAALAGLIVERAVGAPLDVYTKRSIFTPLGMRRTGWFMRDVDMREHSTLFISQNGTATPILPYGPITYPDGGLRTSVEDLSKFLIALLNDGATGGARILDAASATEMQRFQFSDGNRPTNYPAADGNSGLFWRTKLNGTRVGHGGNDPGVEVEMLSDLSRRVAVVYMSNTSLGGTDRRATSTIFDALWKFGTSRLGTP
jgi:CubicO group peptidase (beta-lactamase class C family)